MTFCQENEMKNVLEYVEHSAELYPDKTAFADENNYVTYSQLLELSRKTGLFLAEQLDTVKNRPVAVLLSKTAYSIGAFMGVVYSGNFYVVIDEQMPVDRINTILEALNPVAVLTDEAHMETASKLKVGNINEENNDQGYNNGEAVKKIFTMEQIGAFEASDYGLLEEIRSSMIDTDPVYALFTSGSTGVPKGAVICHKNILSYIDWYSETFGINEKTVFGNQTPFYFSMSVSDVFSTLKCGATLHIIPKLCFSFPIKLMEFMKERKVNTIYWVPSALCIVANYEMFKYAELPDLKKVLFAGEVMPTRQLNYWIKSMPDAMFANLFGPTETTDICTYYVVDREFADDEPLPMGRACNNCDVFVVDEQGNLVAPDIDKETGYSPEGELYARGSFLAMGYYGNPEKTAEAFVQNPLNPYYPELVYKTGDLVKYNKYGELVYITRKDFQIKHMGYRIELGEIEAGAGAIQGIKSCACVYDAEVDKIVFVYEGKKLEDKDIIDAISARVPHYMVPNVVVRVKSMPHNQNGKIDRKLLQGNYKQYIK